MKRTFLLVGLVLGALLLGACAPAAEEGASAEVLTQAAQIAMDGLTQTAAAAPPTATPTTVPPTATPTQALPSATPSPIGTAGTTVATAVGAGLATQTPQPSGGGTSGGNVGCLRASFEIETVPDNTQFNAGQGFTKTWRLKNTGSCTWTAAFNAVWVQGDLMGADSVVPFTEVDIFPGQYAMIEVNMVAPAAAGHYKGYWMLRSNDGIVFGVGANGREWFWVDIESVAVADED
jgi:FtsP/CotA-like multicopper oxidase with cupredoxin domain